MEEVIIEKYKPTGELCATIDFGRNSVNWNKIQRLRTKISQLKKSLVQVVDE